MKNALTITCLLILSSTSFAGYKETCKFTIGGQPYLTTQIAVIGPEKFGKTLEILDVNGKPSASISAKSVPVKAQPVGQAQEQERFQLDAGGTSAFDALVFYVPSSTDTALQAKIFFKSNAVTSEISGSCQYGE